MSYLKDCSPVRDSSDDAWRIQWRSVKGTVWLEPDPYHSYQLHYRRYSKLGELLGKNSECERKFIADAIQAHCGKRPTTFVGI